MLLAAVVAVPAGAQTWGRLDCEVVREYVNASVDSQLQTRAAISAISGELNANRGYLPMVARERFDDLVAPFAYWRPFPAVDDTLIARLLDDRCDASAGR